MATPSQSSPKGLRHLLRPKKSNSQKPEKSAESPDSQKIKAMSSLQLDSERTIARHQKACQLLLSCLPKSGLDDSWDWLEFSQLENESTNFDDGFIQKVNQILEFRKGPIKDCASWAKCCQTVECILAALIPFSKNLLAAANPVQSVSSHRR